MFDENLRQKTQSVPKQNKFSETIFGHLDRILREKPNSTLIANEAYVMFIHNKTLEWIREKSNDAKEKLLNAARKEVKKGRLKFKNRLTEIARQRRQLLEDKMRVAEEAEAKRLQKLQAYSIAILDWGLCQTTDQVDFHLTQVIKSKKDQLEALKAQLNFRRFILNQKLKDDKNIYCVTKLDGRKRINLTLTELSKNVKKLIENAFTVQVTHTDADEDDTPLLVGKNIKMFFEGTDGATAYYGHVISTVPGFHDWYNVKFTGDQAIYTYELLKDYKKGDVE